MSGLLFVNPVFLYVSHSPTAGDFALRARLVQPTRKRSEAKSLSPMLPMGRLPLVDDHFHLHAGGPNASGAAGAVSFL